MTHSSISSIRGSSRQVRACLLAAEVALPATPGWSTAALWQPASYEGHLSRRLRQFTCVRARHVTDVHGMCSAGDGRKRSVFGDRIILLYLSLSLESRNTLFELELQPTKHPSPPRRQISLHAIPSHPTHRLPQSTKISHNPPPPAPRLLLQNKNPQQQPCKKKKSAHINKKKKAGQLASR